MNEKSDPRIPISDGFYLGRIARTDKAAYLEHLADPEIARNTVAIPFPYTEADADWWLDDCEKQACNPEKRLAIRDPADYLIGAIGIGSEGDLPGNSREAEFGYWLAKPYRGRGLMSRTIRVFAIHAFEQLGFDRLYATPFAFNVASQRALEKAGFRREKLLHQHYVKNGGHVDAFVYGLRRGD